MFVLSEQKAAKCGLTFCCLHAALWFWGPSTAALLAYLPAINLTEWRPASPLALLSNLVPASAPVPATVPVPALETPVEQTPATPVSQAPVRYNNE